MAFRISETDYGQLSDRIGYAFVDRGLLARALTHASTKRAKGDYQRLEFLGDRVLGLVIAEYLFRHLPELGEGPLSALYSRLVRGESCARVGLNLSLDAFIRVGEGEKQKGLNLNASVVGDVVEALIAAIYLDGGLEPARTFILSQWRELLAAPDTAEKDPKTFLQEWVLARALPLPEYQLVGREGPEHAPVFSVEVRVSGHDLARGEGTSKRAAEQDAAQNFLRREEIRT